MSFVNNLLGSGFYDPEYSGKGCNGTRGVGLWDGNLPASSRSSTLVGLGRYNIILYASENMFLCIISLYFIIETHTKGRTVLSVYNIDN